MQDSVKEYREKQAAIRRRNLQSVANKLGGAAAVARKADKAVQQISDMLRGTKSFGPKIARDLEKRLGLPDGALDKEEFNEGNVEKLSSGVRLVPILDYVQAGLLTGMGNACYDEYAPVPENYPAHTYGLRIRGESMLPDFEEGDIVFMDPDRCPIAGNFVLGISTSGILSESTFKQYVVTGVDKTGRDIFDLKPLNPLFPTLHSIEHELQVIAVCIGRFTSFI